MKRFLFLIMAIFITLGLFGCVEGREKLNKESSSVEQRESRPDESSKTVSSEESADASEAPDTPSAESVLKVIDLYEGRRLYLSKSGNKYALSLLADNRLEEIHKDWNIRHIKTSPDLKKVIFNDFDFEVTAKVYMYDAEKKQKKQLSLSELPEQRTAAYMEWLDDRYFLFVVQLDQGTIVRGGELYVYDTETDKYKKIVKGETDYMQISAFDTYGDSFILITCEVYDESWANAKREYYLLSVNSIKDSIAKEKVITLVRKNAVSFS